MKDNEDQGGARPELKGSNVGGSSNNSTAFVSTRHLGGSSGLSAVDLLSSLSPSRFVIYPWSKSYKIWWSITVFASLFTIYSETYQIAFPPAGLYPYNDAASIIEYILVSIFAIDIIVNFHLAYIADENEISKDNKHTNGIVIDRLQIAQRYLKFMFWADLIGVFPFYAILLIITNQLGNDSTIAQYLSLVRLLRMIRLHRVKQLFDILQYSTKVSLMSLTLLRNFGFALVWTHFAACTMYFIARQYDFDPDLTWIGSLIIDEQINELEKYLTSLYWSVVTFTTVGYGDFSPVNSIEQIWGMIYMLLNMIIHSWIIGSITLLIVKHDEQTGMYRDTLKQLDEYTKLHKFDKSLHKRLKNQIKLDFNNRELSDEQVLTHFPSSVRRKVLRKLYYPSLVQTKLMKGIRQRFIDAFLTTCNVEIFSPGEEIIERGSISSDLFLLVGGTVELIPFDTNTTTTKKNRRNTNANSNDNDNELNDSSNHDNETNTIGYTGSIVGSDFGGGSSHHRRNNNYNAYKQQLHAGDFINEIGFFTESPQIDTVRTVTVCKTLTISLSAYKIIAQDHPGSAGRILQNLLSKVEEMADAANTALINGDDDTNNSTLRLLPKPLSVLKAGSIFDDNTNRNDSDNIDNDSSSSSNQLATTARTTTTTANNEGHDNTNNNDDDQHELEVQQTVMTIQTQSALTAIQDLVKMHIDKQNDDFTTRFLFAASRDDVSTISLMCDQGFDPNRTDYDHRTALMVSAMKGNLETVKKLIEDYKANPNLIDMHGSTALYEAVKNGHESIIDILLTYDAKLCMNENLAASTLCQVVYDGDMVTLRRLLRAKIQVNASDYDKRTAAHLACSEGNIVALKVLAEFGANLYVQDRWGHTLEDEVERRIIGTSSSSSSSSSDGGTTKTTTISCQMLECLKTLKDKTDVVKA